MELIFISIFIILYFSLFSISAKGRIGEKKVTKILSKLPPLEYFVINNIVIQNERGSTQIDHLVISIYGIFVIETKNFSGWIMGGEKSDQWIKNMYGHKYYFYNPIKQNYGHISTLSKTLQIPKNYFISIVAFPNKDNIKIHTTNNVVCFSEIVPTILSYSKQKLSTVKAHEIMTYLLSSKNISKKQINKHIQYAKNRKYLSKTLLKQGLCPYCGNALKTRKGRYGTFIGCSNYPKCKYTHPL